MKDERLTDDEVARLKAIAHADETDLTGPGGIFANAWTQARSHRFMTEHSIPTDLVSKQELAAVAERILELTQASSGAVDLAARSVANRANARLDNIVIPK